MVKKETLEKISIKNGCCGGGSNNAVYGLGFIGSLVYFIQHSSTFADYFWGFVKSIVWPAILAYKAFELLGL